MREKKITEFRKEPKKLENCSKHKYSSFFILTTSINRQKKHSKYVTYSRKR